VVPRSSSDSLCWVFAPVKKKKKKKNNNKISDIFAFAFFRMPIYITQTSDVNKNINAFEIHSKEYISG